jgi:ribosome-associated protein
MNSLEKSKFIAKVLDDKKALDIKVIKISDLTIISDYFVIATATNSTAVKALVDEVGFKMEELDIKPHKIEGYQSKNWIIMDYSDVVVHIFYSETRDFYSLEKLWADGEEIDILG